MSENEKVSEAMSEANVMDKALEAANSLAELVQALSKQGILGDGMMAISHDEYDSLVCNANEMEETRERIDSLRLHEYGVDVPFRERWDMALAMAAKPARVFSQWDYSVTPSCAGRQTWLTPQVELRYTDHMRLQIPAEYTKEQALTGLQALLASVEDSFDEAREETRRLADDRIPF